MAHIQHCMHHKTRCKLSHQYDVNELALSFCPDTGISPYISVTSLSGALCFTRHSFCINQCHSVHSMLPLPYLCHKLACNNCEIARPVAWSCQQTAYTVLLNLISVSGSISVVCSTEMEPETEIRFNNADNI